MDTDFITLAARAKGPTTLLKRACGIVSRYGVTSGKMDRALHLLAQTLRQFNCGASIPTTAVALKRNSETITKYLNQDIEFAVHGYTHVDYSQLTPEEQLTHLRRARDTFAKVGIKAVGFRSPYLRRESHLYDAVAAAGFSYVSNQAVLWDVLEAGDFTPSTYACYERAIAFYDPWLASQRLTFPRLCEGLVEIPVSLPDDEILLDRLGGETNGLVEKVWRRILDRTYQRGDLFTIQLHPERIAGCVDGLSVVLAEARRMSPPVWLARLDEIAAWWRAHTSSTVQITDTGDGELTLDADGPEGTVVLARSIAVDAPIVPWADGYSQVEATRFTVRAPVRPFIGLSPATSPRLAGLLRQQGYITEVSEKSHRYSYYFDQPEFVAADELRILLEIEEGARPLVRLGCWPDGARSALAVTGDIDALTLWDYGLRLVGN